MTPTEICKTRGIKDLNELAELTEVSKQTLMQWARDGNTKFLLAVLAAEKIKSSVLIEVWFDEMKCKLIKRDMSRKG